MKERHKSTREDQELQEFFDQMKQEESGQPVPELADLIILPGVKTRKLSYWKYAAVVSLLIAALGFYRPANNSLPEADDSMEIIISYDTQPNEPEDPLLKGMGQWQSETDIFLTGL